MKIYVMYDDYDGAAMGFYATMEAAKAAAKKDYDVHPYRDNFSFEKYWANYVYVLEETLEAVDDNG